MNFRDLGLVRRMLAGHERAFDEFFEGHFPGLYRFALTRLNHDEDAAEEVAQAAASASEEKSDMRSFVIQPDPLSFVGRLPGWPL